MKKILLIPDSFKGTMSSKEICEIMQQTIKQFIPQSEVVAIPVADGGEGSVDAFISAMKGERINCTVKGPYFEALESFYGKIDEHTAIIEMAACAGLPLVEGRANPMVTTTFGVGELILHAVESGCKKIIVGLGGSCTNDGGTGAAAALGVDFMNEEGESFIPTGGTLHQISRIDLGPCQDKLKDIEIITMCDINNPLYGTNGAAHIFAPQKGADYEMVEKLDKGLKHLAEKIKECCQIDIAHVPGTGAAGGMGAGMIAFLGSRLQMGIETVLDVVKFDELLKGADLVLTGEGKIDTQSLRGKVVMGVANRTKATHVPVIAVVGTIDEGIEPIYDMGVTAVFSINKAPIPFEIAKTKSHENMRFTIENLIRLLQLHK